MASNSVPAAAAAKPVSGSLVAQMDAEVPAADAAEAAPADAGASHAAQATPMADADGRSTPPAPAPSDGAAPIDRLASDLESEYQSLCNKQIAGRSVAWAHLEPVLLKDAMSGVPREVKLRCLHCGSLFSVKNPSRTVSDHMRACRKFAGELPDNLRVKRVRTDAGPAAELATAPSALGATLGGPSAASGVAVEAAPAVAYYRPPDKQAREQPLKAGRAALLFIDTQNYNCHRDGALGSTLQGEEHAHYWQRIAETQPLWSRLAAAARAAGIEVMYTVIQSLTQDGRDRGLDYKLSGFHVPPGCWDAKVLDCIQPGRDEIVLPKVSSSVFGSTTIASLLRNMGLSQLAVCGALTDQCVEHAVRDAADADFLVTMITDACVTHTQERHDASVAAVAGYCRQRTAAQLLQELQDARQAGGSANGGATTAISGGPCGGGGAGGGGHVVVVAAQHQHQHRLQPAQRLQGQQPGQQRLAQTPGQAQQLALQQPGQQRQQPGQQRQHQLQRQPAAVPVPQV